MRTFKYRWSSALGTSLACHVVALGLITGFMLLLPAPSVNKGPIEVDLVTMSGGGGGGGGNGGETPQEEKLPEIKEAKATPTAPPPVKAEPDPEAENDVHEVAPAPSEDTSSAADTYSGDSTSEGSTSSGTGGGTGGGNGTGNGPGDGSGEGPGSGSGGGNGSGYGSGNGDGAGPGDGVTMRPQILSQPPPAYPESCRKANIHGTTVVGLTISSDGSVLSAWVDSSSGNDTLDSAAVNAVYGWRFVPAKQNGVAITCNSQVPVTFNLR